MSADLTAAAMIMRRTLQGIHDKTAEKILEGDLDYLGPVATAYDGGFEQAVIMIERLAGLHWNGTDHVRAEGPL